MAEGGSAPESPGADWVCLGRIVAAVGIRGEVKVKPFTSEPQSVAAYGPVRLYPHGGEVILKVSRLMKDGVAVRVSGVADRNAAEALKGASLYVLRTQLPALEDEDDFYYTDLIGLRAEDESGAVLGRVVTVHQFGPNDVLEIQGDDRNQAALMVSFTKATVPVVDVKGGRIVVSPPLPDEDD